MDTGDVAITVMVMEFEIAGFGSAQVRLVVIMQYMLSPLFGTYVNLLLRIGSPTGIPFFIHWYVADPPFTPVAVKVTCVPWHTVVAEAVMVTLTGRVS